MELALVVIKTKQFEKVIFFYKHLGFAFKEEKHGNGPLHASAQMGPTLFEIYPLPATATTDATTRLGFRVDELDAVIARLKETGLQVVREPMQTEWGKVAIAKDPDGRSIELYQK